MRIPIARCAHCSGLFVLEHYAEGSNHCSDCYPNLVEKNDGGMTPWKHIGWIDEGILLVWNEVVL